VHPEAPFFPYPYSYVHVLSQIHRVIENDGFWFDPALVLEVPVVWKNYDSLLSQLIRYCFHCSVSRPREKEIHHTLSLLHRKSLFSPLVSAVCVEQSNPTPGHWRLRRIRSLLVLTTVLHDPLPSFRRSLRRDSGCLLCQIASPALLDVSGIRTSSDDRARPTIPWNPTPRNTKRENVPLPE
jgi:hypothetical protein